MGTGPYPVNRNRTIFTTTLVPQDAQDTFLVYYGAADAVVAHAIIQVTHSQPRARCLIKASQLV